MSPLNDNVFKHLSVDYLIQSGRRTELGVDSGSNQGSGQQSGGTIDANALLASIRLSLRPTVKQRMWYQSVTVTGVEPSTWFRLKLKPSGGEASYLIQSGTPEPAAPLYDSSGPKDTDSIVQMPKEGSLVILLRGKLGVGTTIAQVEAETLDQPPKPLNVQAPVAFPPLDWRAAYFTSPPEAPWESSEWANFQTYMSSIRSDLKVPDFPKADKNDLAALLTWLERFFEDGGDLASNDGTAGAATGKGPWISAAYLRRQLRWLSSPMRRDESPITTPSKINGAIPIGITCVRKAVTT